MLCISTHALVPIGTYKSQVQKKKTIKNFKIVQQDINPSAGSF